jgi:hypothetical protein
MNAKAVSLHIERLVLDGIPVARSSAMQIQIAVQQELTRLLSENGKALPQMGYALQAATAPGFHMGGDPTPKDLGKNIAQSIFESLKQES